MDNKPLDESQLAAIQNALQSSAPPDEKAEIIRQELLSLDVQVADVVVKDDGDSATITLRNGDHTSTTSVHL